MSKTEKHILLVDDNEDIVKLITTMLRINKYKVTSTTSPQRIEQLIEKVAPDMVLMDMLMSGHDGREICRNLKSKKAFKQLPVVIISAHPTARVDCIAAGADDFIEKPFEMGEFLKVIERVIN